MRPNVCTYNALISAYDKGGQWEQAREASVEMKTSERCSVGGMRWASPWEPLPLVGRDYRAGECSSAPGSLVCAQRPSSHPKSHDHIHTLGVACVKRSVSVVRSHIKADQYFTNTFLRVRNPPRSPPHPPPPVLRCDALARTRLDRSELCLRPQQGASWMYNNQYKFHLKSKGSSSACSTRLPPGLPRLRGNGLGVRDWCRCRC